MLNADAAASLFWLRLVFFIAIYVALNASFL